MPLLTPVHVGACVAFGCKRVEGRARGAILCIRNGFQPCAGCTVLLFAPKHLYIRCALTSVVQLETYHQVTSLITLANFRTFVPWVRTRAAALRVYRDMDDGTGYIFFFLRKPTTCTGSTINVVVHDFGIESIVLLNTACSLDLSVPLINHHHTHEV